MRHRRNDRTYILAFQSRPPFDDQGRTQSAEAPENLHARTARSVGLLALIISAGFFIILPFSATVSAAEGGQLAANGNSNGAPACSACHGDQGEGRPDAAYPRLAGLNSGYLLRQPNDFADKKRESETMQPIAKGLGMDERTAVSSFYGGLSAPKVQEPKKPDDKTLAIGAALALRGDWSKGLPGCGQCHGPGGQGVGDSFPKLAAQSAEYIVKELKAWREGKRGNDPLNLMTGIASKLDEAQMAAVAAYYASLPVVTSASAGQKGTKP